ncbi:MAG: HNH endonuclease [Acidobacteriia bacterium]|nr:HNH endonuclease [Terriglobia bacterium]
MKTVKRLFALSRNTCAFPACGNPIVEDSGTVTGVVCHIKARSSGGPRYDSDQSEEERHSFVNLILLCARHAMIVDSEPRQYTADCLRAMKASHEERGTVELSQAGARKAELLLDGYRTIQINAGGHVMLASPGGVQASTVVMKTEKKSFKIQPVPGSLASDLLRRNYVKHLIDRYNKFARVQPGRDFQHLRIYKRIEERYGAKWDFVPLHRFDDLVSYLQQQVDRTMLGRIKRRKGDSNYSTFSEYRQRYAES